MFARHLFRVGLFSLCVAAAGCSQIGGLFHSSAPDAAAPPQAAASANDPPAPDALAAKVQNYANEVAPQLNNTQLHSAPAPAAAAPATQPVPDLLGSVAFTPAPAISLSNYKPDTNVTRPQANDAPQTQTQPPVANATGDANFPLIVPESADRQAAAGDAVPAADVSGGNLDVSTVPADQLEKTLSKHVRDYPRDLDGQLDYQLLEFIEGQPVPDMTSISGLAGEDREVLSAIMDGLSNFRSVVRAGNNPLLGRKVAPLLDMADRLRGESELTISTVSLCSQVRSFGVYVPVQPQRFVAGRDNQTIVYCEVQNFQSQLTADSQWQTRLSEEMTLYTDTGTTVWPDSKQPQTVVDLCREKRHDFFVAKLVTLPRNLSIGRFVMKVTVTDQFANRVAEATTPLEIIAEPTAP